MPADSMLDNQVVLVTGASRGIGKAIALNLGKSGAVVVGTATSESGASPYSTVYGELETRSIVTITAVLPSSWPFLTAATPHWYASSRSYTSITSTERFFPYFITKDFSILIPFSIQEYAK